MILAIILGAGIVAFWIGYQKMRLRPYRAVLITADTFVTLAFIYYLFWGFEANAFTASQALFALIFAKLTLHQYDER